jgi:predicted lipoprotein
VTRRLAQVSTVAGRTGPLVAAGALLGGLLAACSSGAEPTDDTEATQARRALLASEVDRVIVPAFERLVTSAEALQTAAAAYAAAAESGEAPSERMAAQAAFETMMQDLQVVELMQMGPYGPSMRFAGGLGIRDEMYSWPIVSACRVDQETVEAAYGDAGFFEAELPNVYGADALERLLYATGTDNACPAPHPINMQGSWTALGDEGIRVNRARYAAAVATQLAAEAGRVRDAWTSGFADGVRSPGEGASAYRTTQQAVDELFASIFYLEKEVKDTKLGAPLGVTAACDAGTCPDLLEARFAGASLAWVQANLQSFELLFHGGRPSDADAYGFDDLLAESGAPDLAMRMRAALDDARAAAAAAPTPLRDHLDDPAATALHGALVTLARDLKTQFVSVLALRVPSEGAADND